MGHPLRLRACRWSLGLTVIEAGVDKATRNSAGRAPDMVDHVDLPTTGSIIAIRKFQRIVSCDDKRTEMALRTSRAGGQNPSRKGARATQDSRFAHFIRGYDDGNQ